MAHAATTARTLALSHITYTYPGSAKPVLVDLAATFPSGWTGIVGDNGCGKSTLARIACRLILPDSGGITGPELCCFCEQDPSRAPDALEEFACDWSPEAVRLRDMLNITDDMPWRFAELSCGEQKKLQVAVALWQRPDVLVLDEPTNHVDAACRHELLRACAAYRGIGIVISHDRELLDTLVDQCLCFEGAPSGGGWRAVMRPGSYTQSHDQAQREMRETERARASAQAQLARIRAEEQRRSQEAARATAKRSKRHIDPKDRDAKGRIDLAIYTGKDGQAGRLAQRMGARAERMAQEVSRLRVEKRYDGSLWLQARPHPRQVLLHLEACTIPCGERHTLAIPELYVGNRDHVGIEGPNGAGKSTFVRHALTCIAPDIDALVIPQELPAEQRCAFMERLRTLDDVARGQLLSLVAQLNSDPKRILADAFQGKGEPSPGELRKLMLAEGVLRSCPLIIMDEPTNHLDLHSVEALETALAAFPGALMLVSHDAAFLATCTSRTLHVENGAVREVG